MIQAVVDSDEPAAGRTQHFIESKMTRVELKYSIGRSSLLIKPNSFLWQTIADCNDRRISCGVSKRYHQSHAYIEMLSSRYASFFCASQRIHHLYLLQTLVRCHAFMHRQLQYTVARVYRECLFNKTKYH